MPVLTNADRTVLRLLRPLPAPIFTYLVHFWLFHERPSFKNPVTFTERVHAKKLFNRDPLLTLTADKFTARQYAAQRAGPELLTELYAVADDPADLDYNKLPSSFVAKATHGNEANLIVHDKRELDWQAATIQMRQWLKTNWYRYNKEWAYRNIPPRILVEEFLNDNGQPPLDYKFFVFSGRVRMLQVDVGRFTRHERSLFDENGRPLAVACRFPRPATIPHLPSRFVEMKLKAEQLGADFQFARIDLYQYRDRIVFGEITHYPGGGSELFEPREFDVALGDVWGHGRALPERFYHAPKA